ncbi:MAG TPA: hypothetical protein DEA96_11250 [Leptospiraceae bacterium]|nr:hypothetical protein [Leptospiraceae bacterium]
MSGMNLDQDLETRINPEKNRQFAPEEFGRRLIQLKEFAIHHWPRKNGLRISVVGTNGKGSVSHYLSSLLLSSGIQTGVYSSPHLEHYSERIQIEGKSGQTDLNHAYLALRSSFMDWDADLWHSLSYFELLTLLAIELFQASSIPVQIYEAGLGGRLDASGLCDPDIVIVTRIALDHTKLLGNTREAIFQEKLGIAGKSARYIFLMEERYENLARNLLERAGHEDPSANSKEKAVPAQVHCFEAGGSARQNYLQENFAFAKWILTQLADPLMSSQIQDAGSSPSLRLLKEKIQSFRFSDVPAPPGRMLDYRGYGIRWMYDSGHNPASLFTVLKSFSTPPLLVLGILPDRYYAHFLRVARWLGVSVIFCIERPGLADIPEEVRYYSLEDSREAETYGTPGLATGELSESTASKNPVPGTEADGHFPSRVKPSVYRLSASLSASQLRKTLLDCAHSKQYGHSRNASKDKKQSVQTEEEVTILFTGSYRIYDLFLEILGGDIVHA